MIQYRIIRAREDDVMVGTVHVRPTLGQAEDLLLELLENGALPSGSYWVAAEAVDETS